MLQPNYPRIKTFAVPLTVKAEYIGDYVSDKVTAYIDELGTANINTKSALLRPITEYLYVLMFYGKSYTLPKDLEIHGPHTGQYEEVDEGRGLASRNAKRPSLSGKGRAKKQQDSI